ncbi:expressed unknown protein [Seminavis robusta]|uniref:Uncharacterized protein n=1 Tax=Seminavis robusta TaxID=568900 RepID=A0A9N8H404_9STRA|nr:expressed unknown protein [Seminavis robusta]|eukprot:Sro73_g040340.1 n/a (653) ;mRNA; f:55180-57243
MVESENMEEEATRSNQEHDEATPETASRSSNASTLSNDQLQQQQQRKVPSNIKTTMSSVKDEENVAEDYFVDELDERGNMDDNSLDSEFEAYVAAYRARKRGHRLKKLRPTSNCSGVLQLVLVGLLVQLLTIACLVIVYMALEKNEHAPGQSKETSANAHNDDASNSLTEVSIVFLQPPPQNIHRFCRENATLEALQTCSEICDRAHCCHISRNELGSCWDDNLHTCKHFIHSCSILETLKSKPDDSTGGQHDDVPSVAKTTVFPNAQVLWDRPDYLPSAPDHLLVTCQAAFAFGFGGLLAEESSGAKLTCHEVCHSAACCWDSALTEPADRCWTHPNCGPYVEACESLMMARDQQLPEIAAQQKQVIPESPDDLSQICDAVAIKTKLSALLACQQACLPAEVCWNEAMVDRRDDSQATTCSGYEAPCSILSIAIPESTTNLLQQLQKLQATAAATPTLPEAADSEPVETVPPASEITLPFNQSIPSSYSPETIRDACFNHDNSVNIHEGQKTLCQQACQAGSCCFYEDYAVSHDSPMCPSYLPDNFCAKYTPCESIFAHARHSGTKQKVREVCTNLHDLSQCVSVCAEATCCFTNDPWEVCAVTNPDVVCSDYHTCEVLYSGADDVAQQSTFRKHDGMRRHRRSLLRLVSK